MARIKENDVIAFWAGAGRKKWYQKNKTFDAQITRKFKTAHKAAKAGHYDDWQLAPDSMMALIILLDQFPRNIYRDDALAFTGDGKALALAHKSISRRFDRKIHGPMRQWFYMPLMHSENMADQKLCLELTKQAKLKDTYKWAVLHADIIERFGRFPHRNILFDRISTPEELAFLKQGGFAG